MADEHPVGTYAGPGREVGPFQGTPSQIPAGWQLAVGQTIPADQHDNPKFAGRPWKVLDLTRQFVTGVSTHIDSWMDADGKVGRVQAANQDIPGLYCLVKVRNP